LRYPSVRVSGEHRHFPELNKKGVDAMRDLEKRESRPDEPKAGARANQNGANHWDKVTNLINEFDSFYKEFEQLANKFGYVSPRKARERRKRREREFRKDVVDIVTRAARLAGLIIRSRGSKERSTSRPQASEGEEGTGK
jgi:hypothetical protein